MTEVPIAVLTCKRCGHQWVPRRPVIITCPKCKNPYWFREKGYDSLNKQEMEIASKVIEKHFRREQRKVLQRAKREADRITRGEA